MLFQKQAWDKLKKIAQRWLKRSREVTRVTRMSPELGFPYKGSAFVDFNDVYNNVDATLFPDHPLKAPILIGPGKPNIITIHRRINKSWRIGHGTGIVAGMGIRQRNRRNAVYLRKAYEKKYGVKVKETIISGFQMPVDFREGSTYKGRGMITSSEFGTRKMYQRRISLSRWMPGFAA